MAKTQENKPIVAKWSEFRELSLDEARSAAIGMEIPVFPFVKDDIPTPPAAWVIGTSIEDIYSAVTGKEWLIRGPKAKMRTEQIFKSLKVVPIVVSDETFSELMKGKQRLQPEQFNRVVKTIFQIPLQVAVEK